GTVLRGAPATGGEAEMLDFDHLTLFRTPYLIDIFQLVCSLWPAAGFVDTRLGLHRSVLERHGA
ncbi:MAG: hypothetical protein MUE83_14260, partial [Tabrizicola sp.]|nr:hypothetical protein [Tabrizicola sp.]